MDIRFYSYWPNNRIFQSLRSLLYLLYEGKSVANGSFVFYYLPPCISLLLFYKLQNSYKRLTYSLLMIIPVPWLAQWLFSMQILNSKNQQQGQRMQCTAHCRHWLTGTIWMQFLLLLSTIVTWSVALRTSFLSSAQQCHFVSDAG